jgi:hypothetical protein
VVAAVLVSVAPVAPLVVSMLVVAPVTAFVVST